MPFATSAFLQSREFCSADFLLPLSIVLLFQTVFDFFAMSGWADITLSKKLTGTHWRKFDDLTIA
ncbi:MAG: hypothetical protein A2Z20_01505 [Bdellovibrionales bacterium RBG_16_40_8]|nr:MAG: hypothetical protein A2Z20_01505 [Bdellovibrionales bacterium RBG_16_40_8]